MNFLPKLALAFAAWLGPATSPVAQTYVFAHDNVLGTSLDITFTAASEADAERAHDAAMREIERLRAILSSYDARSELQRLVAAGRIEQPSASLVEVLRAYDLWQLRSHGAFSSRVAPFAALWRTAEARGVRPDSAALLLIAARVAAPAWRIAAHDERIEMLTADAVDLNSIGKGYIIDRAMAAARHASPALRGGLLNLGGDIHMFGVSSDSTRAWIVGVADPRATAENAPPLTVLQLGSAAVSSSGGYARGFMVAGTHYSHIIDPRTGEPANAVAATTVLAADNATANALATTLSVLPPVDGIKLVESVPGAHALIVSADGTRYRTSQFALFERSPGAASVRGHIKATVTIDITPEQPNRHRPYVAVWITDTAGAPIRTLAFWGTKRKYIPDMSKWYGTMSRYAPQVIDAVTRATRAFGEYTLEWDGLDDEGVEVPAGLYVFWFEAALENGPHSVRSTTVDCSGSAGIGAFERTPAFVGGSVHCTSVE